MYPRSFLRSAVTVLLSAVLLTGCAGPAAPPSAPSTPSHTEPASPELPSTLPSTEAPTVPSPEDQLRSAIRGFSIEEKVGQLFLVVPEALLPDASAPVAACSPELEEALRIWPVGGIVMFADNLTGPEQISELNADLQAASRIPLFLAVDEEGGTVARLAGHSGFDLPRYSSAGAVGSSGDPLDARDMGLTIGGYLARYGFNMDFAPVADVNTNPRNPVIGNRAFSSDPFTAAELAEACADGLHSSGIIPVFKHFPGHGDTMEDSHQELAVTERTIEEMLQCEWLPFERANAASGVMVGHIAAPAILGDDTPASLSPEMVNGLLKEELGFSGLVITDSLSMGAITNSHSPEEAARLAFEAGCHILLMPENLQAAFDGLVSDFESGILSEADLDQRVLEILLFKQEQLGLLSE